MAYNNYFPASYQPVYYSPQYQPPQPVPQVQQVQPQAQAAGFSGGNQSNGLIWVQGEAGAKSYLVAPNTTVMLMDSETQRFYLKSADASGMPLPLRTFEYSEVTEGPKQSAGATKPAPPINGSEYVLKSEFEALRGRVEALLGETGSAVKHEKEAGNE